MGSINDLRSGPNSTGTGVASGTDDGKVLNFGSVNISKANQDEDKGDNTPGVLNLGSVNVNATKRKIKSTDNVDEDEYAPPKRKIADLSTLPKRDDTAGVDIKESIEDEVFKPGGDFDNLLSEKKKEYQEVLDLIDEHNAQVAAELGQEVPTDEELEEIGTEDMTAALIGTKYYNQSDDFGRASGEMKTSPLEMKAAREGKTLDQYVSGEDGSKSAKVITDKNGNPISINDPESTNKFSLDSEEEYMDELEKEINEEIGTIDENIELISTDSNNENDEEVIEEIAEDIEAIEDDEPEEQEETKEEPKRNIKKDVDPDDNIPIIEPKVVEPKKEEEKTSYEKVENAVKDPNVGVDVNMSIDEDDIDIELEGDDTAISDIKVVDEDENMKEFQAAISEKIKPVTKALNLNSFKVINKPVSLSEALNKTKKAAMSWALPNSNQYIAMSEFSGKEIEQLGDTSGLNRYEIMKNRYQLFYNHIISPKAATFEQWIKTTSFLDNDHLYFAVYGANFAGSNFIPYDCSSCKNTFLSDNIPLEDMYKFKDDEAKEKFNKIRNQQNTTPAGLYVSEVVQISDTIAIGFRDPSIYNIIFETAMLDDTFTEKYRDIIAVLSYIDNIYLINAETQSIAPISYKIDKNNTAKTIKARIITYAKILEKLAPDQYYIILSYLNAINSRGDEITYIKPEVTCPNCGTVIPEQEVTAESMVFTRAQLASLSATSLN